MSRRQMVSLMACAALTPRFASGEAIIDLDWDDLLPPGQPSRPMALQGLIQHDGPDLSGQQPASTGVRTQWNGLTVRIPGFVVPIDHQGQDVTAFLLVPYVGACVHVPPPPANQLVFVTTSIPFRPKGMFDAVSVTGMFGTSAMRTHLAEVGYAMSAERIEPYG